MPRNSFQQGYVSDLVRKRGGPAFTIRYRVRTGDGKWKHRSETLYGLAGKKEARAILEQRIREASVRPIEVSDLTVEGLIDGYWKPYLVRRGAKPSTLNSYESAIQKHILPALGKLKLADVAPLHIETFAQAKLKSGLSAKSVRNLVVLLQGIFSLATDNDLITRSPIRSKHKPTVHRHEKPVWTPEQTRLIVGAVHGVYRALFVTAALTAARLGEILALRWQDIDFDAQTVRIKHSLWHNQLLPPKTSSSNRTIPFGRALNQVLSEHSQSTPFKGPNDFVFSKKDGTPLNPDVLRKDVLYPALDRLGIPRGVGTSGFHTFRHSAASLINSQTGNLKLAQKLLGHSSINMTADVYTHTSAESEREAAIVIERAIYGELFAKLFPIENKTVTAAVN
jgi:integrase